LRARRSFSRIRIVLILWSRERALDLTRITTLEDLQKLLEALGRHGIGEFEFESGGNRLRIAKTPTSEGAGLTVLSGLPGVPAAAPPPAAAPAAAEAEGPKEPALAEGVKVITSPMVGTFYRAPSPEADPFVSEGDRVAADATVGLIEAMKVMNEIPSGHVGVIEKVLVSNGESVEFGQALYHIKTE